MTLRLSKFGTNGSDGMKWRQPSDNGAIRGGSSFMLLWLAGNVVVDNSSPGISGGLVTR